MIALSPEKRVNTRHETRCTYELGIYACCGTASLVPACCSVHSTSRGMPVLRCCSTNPVPRNGVLTHVQISCRDTETVCCSCSPVARNVALCATIRDGDRMGACQRDGAMQSKLPLLHSFSNTVCAQKSWCAKVGWTGSAAHSLWN